MPGPGAGHFFIYRIMENSKDPMETGTFPMPDFDAPSAHEKLILQNMALMLTGRFVGKIMPYIQPAPGLSYVDVFITLTADVLKVAAMSMEMSKPSPDAPKDFATCLESASVRITDLLKDGIDPEAKAELEANIKSLTTMGMAADMLNVLESLFPKPPQ
jgi:hypothetical protein